jgi:transcriptional regulator with XRE-family HTH domain
VRKRFVTSASEQPADFAGKLNFLIEWVHPLDRGPYSYRELAEGVKAATGVDMSPSLVHQIATGKRKNPRIVQAQALAAFFGVEASYFFDDSVAERINEQIRDVTGWRDEAAREHALRYRELPHEGQMAVDNLMRAFEEQRSLPPEQRRRSRRDG